MSKSGKYTHFQASSHKDTHLHQRQEDIHPKFVLQSDLTQHPHPQTQTRQGIPHQPRKQGRPQGPTCLRPCRFQRYVCVCVCVQYSKKERGTPNINCLNKSIFAPTLNILNSHPHTHTTNTSTSKQCPSTRQARSPMTPASVPPSPPSSSSW